MAGETTQGRLQLGGDTPALIVPIGPFLERTGGDWIFVVAQDGESARAPPDQSGPTHHRTARNSRRPRSRRARRDFRLHEPRSRRSHRAHRLNGREIHAQARTRFEGLSGSRSRDRRARRSVAGSQAGRVPRRHGPFGLRQVDAAQHPRADRLADRRPVLVHGRGHRACSEEELTLRRRAGVGFVFQNFNLIDDLNVARERRGRR